MTQKTGFAAKITEQFNGGRNIGRLRVVPERVTEVALSEAQGVRIDFLVRDTQTDNVKRTFHTFSSASSIEENTASFQEVLANVTEFLFPTHS